MIKIIFLLLLLGQNESKKDIPVYCDADYMEYTEKEEYVYTKGNVVIKYEDIIMKSDEAKLNRTTNEVEAKGNIHITQKEQEIHGDTANYNIEKKIGTVTNVDFYSKPWYFKGEKVDKPSEKQAEINKSDVTTCKYKEAPHYHIWSYRINVEQDEKIEGWHNLFYIGPVPIFYWPYFYRSLKDNRSPISLRAGYTDSEGYYIKSTYAYYFAMWLQGYIYLDYMEKKGWGYGLEPNFVFEDGSGEGKAYIYYIKEKDTRIEKWRVIADHRQSLRDDLDATARLDYQSDKDFSMEYTSSPTVKRELGSHLSLTKRDPYYTLTTSWQRYDVWNNDERKYIKASESLPELNFTILSSKIFDRIPLYYSFRSNFRNYYTISNDYYIKELDTSPGLSHSYTITPLTTYSTNLTFNQVYKDRNDKNVDNMGFIHSYYLNNNLRHRWAEKIETDLGHSFKQRLTKREADPSSVDTKGVEVNKIFGGFYYVDYPGLTISTTTSYNFKSDGTNDEFNKRLDPLTIELGSQLKKNINYYLRLTYKFDTGKIESTDTYAVFGIYPGWVYKIGYNYKNIFISDVYSSIEIPVSINLRVEAGVRYDTIYKLVKEQTYSLLCNITDCWVLSASMIKYSSSKTPSFGINLRLRAFPDEGIGVQPGLGGYGI